MTSHALITREQERALYAFLRERTDGDALRYELIAKKIHRAADGTHSDFDASVVQDWLASMQEIDAIRSANTAAVGMLEQAEQALPDSFASLRSGVCGNPSYQAFLDTLEQEELDALSNNVPYFEFISARQAEARALGAQSTSDHHAYIRQWADAHLSERVMAKWGQSLCEYPRQR